MNGTHGARAVAVALLVAGCEGLTERPGHDFSVRVLDESPIKVYGQIYAPVRFAVDGCGAFDLALEDGAGVRRALTYAEQADRTFVASVPTAWMSVGRCVGDDFNVNNVPEGRLVATCHDAGRSAEAGFALLHVLGILTEGGQGIVRAIFPGRSPGRASWIATSEFGGEVSLDSGRFLRGEWGPELNPAAYLNPLVRPRLATRGDRTFATLGCETRPDCPLVSIGPGESVPGERLADVALSDGPGAPPRGIAHVSTNVVDLAFAGDGALVVVSDTGVARSPSGDDGLAGDARWGETVVWRVVPAPVGSQGVVEDAATVIARFPRETVVSRLSTTASGALAFVTLAYDGWDGWDRNTAVRVNLHVTDGSTVTTSYTALVPDQGCDIVQDWWCTRWLDSFASAGIYLSPDGAAMILTERGDPWMYWMNTDAPDHAWQPFGKSGYPVPISSKARQPLLDQRADGGATWLPGAMALWSGGDLLYPVDLERAGIVQVFETAPIPVLRYEYVVEALPGATTPPVLVGVASVGDHLALTTTTGVRILDASGALVGGMDPLPCGATTTSTAEQIGPTTVAVGVGSVILRFDVGEEAP